MFLELTKRLDEIRSHLQQIAQNPEKHHPAHLMVLQVEALLLQVEAALLFHFERPIGIEDDESLEMEENAYPEMKKVQ